MKRRYSAPAPYPKRRRYSRKATYNRGYRTKAAKITAAVTPSHTKYFDRFTSSAGVSVTVAFPIIHDVLGGITAGVGPSQYIGETIKPISWTVRYTAGVGDIHNGTRLILMQWIGKIAPSIGEIFEQYIPHSSFKHDNIDDMIVLRDIYLNQRTNGYGPGPSDQPLSNGKIYIKGKKMIPIQFNTDGGITNGMPLLICISDSLVPPDPFIVYYSRMLYSNKQ